ncbi:hypothetical protein FNF29_00018 [Cafeteria roenbergensis]|uniref:Major facilitator superfamily (MFS) profile domain-containing protein n=1 Tax=Cafeteria roenbergensis TaxID=33653 RepID=A0A5A8CWA7_CAFRO|nr:hypothetical protein FNF29_00018 [Cafeteria roenbergensis]|eukprot:KAA0157442.1 hypothetical protein FNF29_00018 [Cafeteria roenbergensis]
MPMHFSPWFKVFLSGVGFWSDAYDLFIINIVGAIMRQPHMFPIDPDGDPALIPKPGFNGSCVAGADMLPATRCETNPAFTAMGYIKTAALVGAILGQLIFGALADKLGRRVIFICTISMVIIGAIGSALVQGSPEDGGIYVQLTIFRFLLGFGVGGEYPLSATVSSESSTTEDRGSAVSNVFAMQGWGNVTAGLVAWALLAAGVDHHITWRVCLGFGAVPGLATVYWRFMMEETEQFKHTEEEDDLEERLLVEGPGLLDMTPSPKVPAVEDAMEGEGGRVPRTGSVAAGAPHAPSHGGGCCGYLRNTGAILYQFRYLLLGTAGAWFIFDVTFYANGLFSDTVFKMISPDATITDVAADNLYTALLGLPGYYLGVYFIDRMGRRAMQIFGFSAVGITFLIMAGLLEPLQEHAIPVLVILYGLTFLFANWGPNTTTYVIPSEVFPTRARATCHGISAASGKLGAVVGSYGIGAMEALGKAGTAKGAMNTLGLRFVLVACGIISIIGTVWSMAFTPNMEGVSMEDIDNGAALGMLAGPRAVAPDAHGTVEMEGSDHEFHSATGKPAAAATASGANGTFTY